MTDRFISVDWGTSNLRVRLASRPDGRILGQIATDEGAAPLAAEHPAAQRAEAFRRTLLRAMEQLSSSCNAEIDALPVVISGMASSTLGWRELEYARLPFALDGRNLVCQALPSLSPSAGSSPVLLLSGVRSGNDVMRGEETEALGLWQHLDRRDDGPAVWIFPGTHSKHLSVERGSLIDCRTYMTGELFDVLRANSVLRHAMQSAANGESFEVIDFGDDFQAGLEEARTAVLTNALFHVRTRAVLSGTSGPANAAFLSGLLIGAEIATIERNRTSVARVVLCATEKMALPYRQALDYFGLAASSLVVPAEAVATLSVRGQCVALDRHVAKLE